MSLSFHRYVRPLCKNDLAVISVIIVIDYSKIVKSMYSERAFLGSSLHRPGRAFRYIAPQIEIDYNNQVLPLAAVDNSAFSLSRFKQSPPPPAGFPHPAMLLASPALSP